MNNSRSERLSDYLSEIDEDLLDNAYAVDDAKKLKTYIKSKKASPKTALFPKRAVLKIAAAAACLILAAAVIFLTSINKSSAALSYDGTLITHEKVAVTQTASPFAASLSAKTAPMRIPLEFTAKGSAAITVSAGNLYGVSENGSEILSFGEYTEISKDTIIWWAVFDGAGSYELTVTENGNKTVYVLEINDLTSNNNEKAYVLETDGLMQIGVIYKK